MPGLLQMLLSKEHLHAASQAALPLLSKVQQRLGVHDGRWTDCGRLYLVVSLLLREAWGEEWEARQRAIRPLVYADRTNTI